MPRDILEVWGDPIAHSKSPALHTAAYTCLGWDWTYGRRRVSEQEFAGQLASLGPEYRGLSCTMPLKAVAFAAAQEHDAHAAMTGAVNTLVLRGDRRRGFNTDVGGIVRALHDAGVGRLDDARIIGAGATATSALVAVAELGATSVDVVARRPDAIAPLEELGRRLGVAVHRLPLIAASYERRDLTLSTLPGAAAVDPGAAEALAGPGGLLFDVVYGHGPTVLASAWERAGHRAVSGEGMLLHQAVLQIRAFSTGSTAEPLPEEEAVVAVMRRALVGG